jgi:outer membrane protein assembly factor BamB
VFVATGNGVSTTSFDDSNAVVRLSPNLVQEDVFAPVDWVQLNDTDTDLGSLSPSLVGGQVFQAGKRGVGYLLSADHLGGVGGQRFQAQVCSRGAYGGTAVDGSTVYVPCRNGLVAVTVADGRFSVAWRGPATPAGTPVVSGGVVWLMSLNGEVLGLDPATGRTRFHSQENAAGSFPALTAAGGQLFVPSGAAVVAYRY